MDRRERLVYNGSQRAYGLSGALIILWFIKTIVMSVVIMQGFRSIDCIGVIRLLMATRYMAIQLTLIPVPLVPQSSRWSHQC